MSYHHSHSRNGSYKDNRSSRSYGNSNNNNNGHGSSYYSKQAPVKKDSKEDMGDFDEMTYNDEFKGGDHPQSQHRHLAFNYTRYSVCPMDVKSNPHVLQVDLNANSGYESKEDIPFARTLRDDSPRLKYRRRQNEVKTVLHWGQRKLLLSEIEFLTKYGQLSNIVVYAGAAPGTHLNILAELFKDKKFVCVDPAPFNIRPTSQFDLRRQLFEDKTAEEFKGKNVLFISDIRAADWQREDHEAHETQVQDDMKAQMRWHNIMEPAKSMLKFRLPWDAGLTEYLDGEIFLPVWGPITTTEARLIPSGMAAKKYDNTQYEEQMFYFNTTQRVGRYRHEYAGEGIDHCYDCMAECRVLEDYVVMMQSGSSSDSKKSVKEEIAAISFRISQSLGRRTLVDGNSDPEERKKFISQRQHVMDVNNASISRPAYEVARLYGNEALQKQPAPMSGVAKTIMTQMGYVEGQALGKVRISHLGVGCLSSIHFRTHDHHLFR